MRNVVLLAAITLVSLTRGAVAGGLTVEQHVAGAEGYHAVSALILGEKEAIIIDAQLTRSEAHRLVARVLESKRTLRAVYITHAHPDHCFGLEVLKQAFPKARLYAAPVVVAEIKKAARQRTKFWTPLLGENLPKATFPTPYKQGTLKLEGQTLELIPLEPGESLAAVMVHVPSIKTVIAGDVVFQGVHPWMAETDAARRAGWLKNLEKIKSLAPTTVIPGHRNPDIKDPAGGIELTASYIRDYDKAVAEAKNMGELKQKMLGEPKYKDLRVAEFLDYSAEAAFPPPAPKK